MTSVYTVQNKKFSFFSNLSVNGTIVLINVVLFIIFSILIYINPNYLNFIAIKPSNILYGHFLWTFLTSMFMHSGFFHIFANMLSLIFIGSLAERILGGKRYLYFYLAAGIFAGLLFVLSSFLFPEVSDSFAVGASGAIFGLVGLLVVITPNLPVYAMFIPIPVKMKYAAPGILIILWLVSVAGNIPIGNTAHFGGFVFGLFYGVYLRKKYKNRTKLIQKYFS